MRRTITAFLGLAALVTVGAAQVNSMDRMFVRQAAQGGVFEVAANRIGLQKSRTAEVKQHSRHMIADHSKANRELGSLARRKRIAVPSMMAPKQRAMISQLRRKSGKAFDREHVKMQLKAHEDTIKLFEKEIQNGGDRELVAWVKKTLPTIETHRDMWSRAWAELSSHP